MYVSHIKSTVTIDHQINLIVVKCHLSGCMTADIFFYNFESKFILKLLLYSVYTSLKSIILFQLTLNEMISFMKFT